MRFGCHAVIQSPGDNLVFVMEDKSKDIGHLAITAWAAKHLFLQLPKGQRQFQEGCAIAQSTGLALDDGKAMPPVIIRQRRFVVADPLMLTYDIALGCNDQSLGIDPQADGPVRNRCRHAVAVPFEGDHACR
ncbi:Hypothetical protein NGAL_HAMBI2605_66050 [Neorhizobium galegae bv. orientalis]|nr:Hypothetical protein NGAL_HAMBI2566_62550 [Neorhizobium galegae bv. orientalis]CDZ68314.1 Hypothetical protein NGAL_HAMBI2605_66050 [Neorhizobium galegae bv. orientalis]CDZ73842.1 Hypothetical protein NGAL_HAMBI2610_54740 [Neorhizobium galegae bv. orientalis]